MSTFNPEFSMTCETYTPKHRAVPCTNCGWGEYRHIFAGDLLRCPEVEDLEPEPVTHQPVTHLLKPLGGTECERKGDALAYINYVTCVDCLERHEAIIADPETRTFQAEVIFTVELDPNGPPLRYLLDPDATAEDQVHAMIVDLLSTYVTPRLMVSNNRALTIHWEMFEGAVGEQGPHGLGT